MAFFASLARNPISQTFFFPTPDLALHDSLNATDTNFKKKMELKFLKRLNQLAPRTQRTQRLLGWMKMVSLHLLQSGGFNMARLVVNSQRA